MMNHMGSFLDVCTHPVDDGTVDTPLDREFRNEDQN